MKNRVSCIVLLCSLSCLLFLSSGCKEEKTEPQAVGPEQNADQAVARIDEQALDKAVVRVLTEHPELVLQALESHPIEFIDILEKSTEKKKEQDFIQDVRAKMQAPFHPRIDPKRPFRGAKDGPVTVVLYSNYGCPYCMRANTTLTELLKKYPEKIKLVLKHFPFEEVTEKCARIFEALGRQDMQKAWDFHEFLFQHRDVLHKKGMAGLQELMQQFGLDVPAVEAEITKDDIKAAVEADMEEVKRMGMNGAPVLVINGVILNGARPLPTLEQVISLTEKQGTKPADKKE